ncbi:MAG: hypothetical protein KatS3mg012_2253 [Gaiellaceae bacterium]|nr:MAG: hypothetical protein KatS3mg012_2253 [Gaiellaceae bacterium]
MRPEAELLFEDFAARYARGEHPDVRDYLERAGDERDALVTLIDGYLASVPAQPPSAETLATFAELALEERKAPPMLAMRVRMGLRRFRGRASARAVSAMPFSHSGERPAAWPLDALWAGREGELLVCLRPPRRGRPP